MNNKNVVIVGGAGFLGSHLSNYLNQKNKVLVLDNLLSGKTEYLNTKIEFKKFDIRYSTIRLYKLLQDFQTDYVFHLAACPFIPDSYTNPGEFVDINIKGTLNVLKACQEANIKKVVQKFMVGLKIVKKLSMRTHQHFPVLFMLQLNLLLTDFHIIFLKNITFQ